MSLEQQIKKQLVTIGMMSGREINEMLLRGYMMALEDLDQSAVMNALNDWMKTGKGFPYPVDIRSKVMPEMDDSDNAQTVANLIVSAVSKDGYTNPESARKRVGELGWAVVEHCGGWKHLCETMTHDNESIMKAQIRDLAKTVSKRAKRGELDTAPALPAPASEVRNIVNTTIKTIGAVEADQR